MKTQLNFNPQKYSKKVLNVTLYSIIVSQNVKIVAFWLALEMLKVHWKVLGHVQQHWAVYGKS